MDNEYWPQFVEYANSHGISLEHVDDWWSWWDCFHAGLEAVHELFQLGDT